MVSLPHNQTMIFLLANNVKSRRTSDKDRERTSLEMGYGFWEHGVRADIRDSTVRIQGRTLSMPFLVAQRAQ
jgi:hypothetical protein